MAGSGIIIGPTACNVLIEMQATDPQVRARVVTKSSLCPHQIFLLLRRGQAFENLLYRIDAAAGLLIREMFPF